MKDTASRTPVRESVSHAIEAGLAFRIDSQTFQALDSLNVKRRVILSGTPIQVYLLQQSFE